MKRFIILSIITFTFTKSFAQYNDFPVRNFDITNINLEQLKFGIKISPAISWINVTHDDAIAGGATMKFGIGITSDYEINELLSAILDINYKSAGGYMADSRSLNNVNTKDYFKVNYQLVEVPLGLKINTPVVNKYNYYLKGGVTTGFVLSANEKMYEATSSKVYKSYDTLTDLTYPTVVGYFAGIGSRYNITKNLKLFVEVNYKNAVASISNGENYISDGIHPYTEPIYIIPATMEFSFGVQF